MIMTVTLFDYLSSELEKSGHDEFKTCDELTGFNPKKSNMTRLIIYDELVQKVCNDTLFYGFELENKDHDTEFKKNIVARFLNREIKFQTVDIFRAMLLAKLYSYKRKLDTFYNDYEKILTSQGNTHGTSEAIGTSDSASESTGNSRSALSTTPQNEINLDLEKPYMNYADNNNINLNKTDSNTKNNTKNDNESKNQSNNYNVDVFYKLNECINDLMIDIDRTCFSQVV